MSRSTDNVLKLTILVFVFFLCIGQLSAADNSYVEGLLNKMEKADQDARAVRFDFSQTITYSATGEKQRKSGEIIFQKPDKIFIRQKLPAEQLLTGNGKKIWVYTPSYNQAVVDSWKKWLKNNDLAYTFFSFAKSFKEFRKQYNFRIVPGTRKEILFALSPAVGGIPSMELLVDENTFIPARTRVFLEGVEIATEISELKINPEIEKDLFDFKAPAKTSIINLNS